MPKQVEAPAVDVAAAEREAAEAEQLLAALEERVRDGDESVTAEQVGSARELGRFAKLRAEAARRKAARARDAERVAQCEALRAEVEAYATGSGQRFADMLRTAEDAVRAFLGAVDERNAQIEQWRRRMLALDVPPHQSAIVPPKAHGQLGHAPHGGRQIIAGLRRIEPLSAVLYLERMLTNALADSDNATGLSVPTRAALPPQELYDRLAALDAPVDDGRERLAALVHFRGQGGAVVSYSPDRAPDEAEQKRHGLKPVPLSEVIGE